MGNADTPGDALAARKNAPDGIVLCRIEHMAGANFLVTLCFLFLLGYLISYRNSFAVAQLFKVNLMEASLFFLTNDISFIF
jgi:hypothetical protein